MLPDSAKCCPACGNDRLKPRDRDLSAMLGFGAFMMCDRVSDSLGEALLKPFSEGRLNLVESNEWYSRHRFSVTCHTRDLGLLYCLRGLCEWAQQGRSGNIARAGTTKEDWEASGGKFTFRFTEPVYRKKFLDKARTLLETGWTVLEQSDDDPAYRHGKRH